MQKALGETMIWVLGGGVTVYFCGAMLAAGSFLAWHLTSRCRDSSSKFSTTSLWSAMPRLASWAKTFGLG